MYEQGDIVLIPVPFSDLKQQKQRPVLIISNDIYNQMTEDIIVLAITSKLKELDYSVSAVHFKLLADKFIKVKKTVQPSHLCAKKLIQIKIN